MKPKRITLKQRRGQQGFSLIVVFSLFAIMAATAAAVLLSTRTDVKVSGRQRESTLSFFTAEAGIAYSKQYLNTKWDAVNFWTAVLAESPRVTQYNMGGIQVGGGAVLPSLKARHTCSFRNNPDDPSLDTAVDKDGRVIVTCTGEAFDAAGTTVLATSTVEVEVEYGTAATLMGNYQAMSNQSASGVASSNDVKTVDMGQAASNL